MLAFWSMCSANKQNQKQYIHLPERPPQYLFKSTGSVFSATQWSQYVYGSLWPWKIIHTFFTYQTNHSWGGEIVSPHWHYQSDKFKWKKCFSTFSIVIETDILILIVTLTSAWHSRATLSCSFNFPPLAKWACTTMLKSKWPIQYLHQRVCSINIIVKNINKEKIHFVRIKCLLKVTRKECIKLSIDYVHCSFI